MRVQRGPVRPSSVITALVAIVIFSCTTQSAYAASAKSRASVRTTAESSAQALQDNVKAKSQILKQKYAAQDLTSSDDHLSGNRLALCQQNETSINSFIASRASSAKTFLQTFESLQDKATAYAAQVGANNNDIQQLDSDMVDQEATAEAAVSQTETTTFSCAAASDSQTAQPTINVLAGQKKALRDYRSDIEAYVDAIKQFVASSQAGSQ